MISKKLFIIIISLISGISYANTYNLRTVDSELNFTMIGKGYIKSGDVSHDINATIKSNIVNTTSKETTIKISMSAFSTAYQKILDDTSTMILDNYRRIIVDGDGCILSNDPDPMPTAAKVGYISDKYIYTCKDGTTNFSISLLKKGVNGYANLVDEIYEEGKHVGTTTTIINNKGESSGFLMEFYLENNGSKTLIKIDFKRLHHFKSLLEYD